MPETFNEEIIDVELFNIVVLETYNEEFIYVDPDIFNDDWNVVNDSLVVKFNNLIARELIFCI